MRELRTMRNSTEPFQIIPETSPTEKKLRRGKSFTEFKFTISKKNVEQFEFTFSIPPNENLKHVSSCTHHSQSGKIYLSDHYICFASKTTDEKQFKVKIQIENVLCIQKVRKCMEITTNQGTQEFHNLKDTAFREFQTAFLDFCRVNPLLHRLIFRNDAENFEKVLGKEKPYPIDFTAVDETGFSPLFAAVRSGNIHIIRSVLSYYRNREMDINAMDDYGWTVLFVAMNHPMDINEDIIPKMLLEHPGIQVEVSAKDGNTPLHYFCKKFRQPNSEDIGEMLISRGADVNRRNKNGETPLHKAILNGSLRLMMVKMLIAHKADVNATSDRGETALHYAVRLQRRDLVKTLLVAGAKAESVVQNITAYQLSIGFDEKISQDISRVLGEISTKFQNFRIDCMVKEFRIGRDFRGFIERRD
eukprot:TRINITY_DN7126_c0_g1_i1.p1 TRINITY_DN7126_c0_g1~~TRINITY_DN7126_c0_g1_i1.p1  ORF type:complete len:445 (-),score=75.85 TRINITY_DN7126_c0_g1_i1:134-1384(-)